MRMIAVLAPLATALVAVMPAAAPAQVQDRVVIVYGDDPCPASNGQDIVVCRRQPKAEQFRIPKDLRESEPSATSLGWASQQKALAGTGANAVQVGGCSATGANVVAGGCFRDQARAWKAEKVAQKKAEESVP